jgi:hypothetical protein
MDVFVVPIGVDRYELYCEQQHADTLQPEPEPTGIVARLRHRFNTMLREAEERRHGSAAEDAAEKGWAVRLQERVMAWVAERVAEQRLLWSLQRETDAVAAHPQDLTFEQVMTLVRRMLQRDYDRHRRWMFIDGLLFLVTFIALGPLFLLIPGVANIPALYFGFRTVGHFFSMRGAKQGLHRVSWTGRPCPPLGELRDLADLQPPARHARITDISSRLRLQHFPSFYERVAI